jgi:hypothetical protein
MQNLKFLSDKEKWMCFVRQSLGWTETYLSLSGWLFSVQSTCFLKDTEQVGIHIQASKATTPSKDFAFKKPFINIMYCTLLVLILYIFFFSSAG